MMNCEKCGSELMEGTIACMKCATIVSGKPKFVHAIDTIPLNRSSGRPFTATIIGILLLIGTVVEIAAERNLVRVHYFSFIDYAVLLGDIIIKIVTGVGLLTIKPWARKLTIVYFVFILFFQVIRSIYISNIVPISFLFLLVDVSRVINCGHMYMCRIGEFFDIITIVSLPTVVSGLFIFLLTRPNIINAYKK